jgi:hypothetical protein
MIPPLIVPREWLDKFAREHPIQAIFFVLFGLGMMIFTAWLVMFK